MSTNFFAWHHRKGTSHICNQISYIVLQRSYIQIFPVPHISITLILYVFLYTCIAQLFSAMLCYGFAPRLFLRSTVIPIPKGGRSSSSNSDHFRSIAISSILSKILDYIIIDQQAHSLITSDHQFGFKPNSSTLLCTTMLVEIVQYYDENGRQPVYVLQLDASKGFDRVSYSRLFNVLLDKNVNNS